MVDSQVENGDFPKIGERTKEDSHKEEKNDFCHMPGLQTFLKENRSSVNKVSLLKKISRSAHRKRISRRGILFFGK